MKSFLCALLCAALLCPAAYPCDGCDTAAPDDLPKDLVEKVLDSARVIKEVTVDLIEVQEENVLAVTPFGVQPVLQVVDIVFYKYDDDSKLVEIGRVPQRAVQHEVDTWKVVFKNYIVIAKKFRVIKSYEVAVPPVKPSTET